MKILKKITNWLSASPYKASTDVKSDLSSSFMYLNHLTPTKIGRIDSPSTHSIHTATFQHDSDYSNTLAELNADQTNPIYTEPIDSKVDQTEPIYAEVIDQRNTPDNDNRYPHAIMPPARVTGLSTQDSRQASEGGGAYPKGPG